MKKFKLLWLLLFSAALARAQAKVEPRELNETKFYTGIGLTNINYHIYYKNNKAPDHISTGYFAPVYLSFGYRPNERVRLQLSVLYGGSKDETNALRLPPDPVVYDYYSRTRVVGLSANMQHVIFNAFKRFPVYATVALLPAYGVSKSETVETLASNTVKKTVTDSGVNVFTTAGFGFNYRISTRFQGYVELLPFKYNITGQNSIDRDWDQYSSRVRQLSRSLALGVNYNM